MPSLTVAVRPLVYRTLIELSPCSQAMVLLTTVLVEWPTPTATSSTRRRATTAAGSAGAATSRTRRWPPRTRCAGRPGRPTRTPCGTGTACSARASPATTRPPSRTASCAAAAAPQSGRYNAMDTRRRLEGRQHRQQLHAEAVRPGQPRRRLHPGVRDQAGLQPDRPTAAAGATSNWSARSATPRRSQWTPGDRPAASRSRSRPARPGRTGRHIVYTIWQASHLDQSYYLCATSTSRRADRRPRPRPRRPRPRRRPRPCRPPRPRHPTPTTPGGSGTCSATTRCSPSGTTVSRVRSR